MTTWLVAFKERTFLTMVEGGCIKTSLISETIKTEINNCFEPTEEGIKIFKKFHEGVDGHYSIEIEVLSWSEIKDE